MFLFGAQITPLISASTHVVADDRRTRKLLLHRHEIDNLIGRVQRDGYTVVPTALYWKGNKVKAEVALAKGKQTHDKREASKERDWAREKQRAVAPAQQERLSDVQCSAVLARQGKEEHRALAFLAFGADRAAVALDDALDRGQADAVAGELRPRRAGAGTVGKACRRTACGKPAPLSLHEEFGHGFRIAR